MKKIGILFLLYIFCINQALAVRVAALYQGVLPVASQSAAERTQLATAGLAQVLIKVSGNKDLLNNPQIKNRLNSAVSLMQEFSYATAPSLPGNPKPYFLQLNFDPEGVNKILRDAGAPIWGQSRPLILVWLTYQSPKNPPEIIGADSATPLAILLKQNMDRRGVPIMFPAMDVEDIAQVSVNDIISSNFPKLITAARRYASDAILVGRITQSVNGYTASWTLILGDDSWDFTIPGNTLLDMFSVLTDDIADTLAKRYATVITNTVQANLILKITGVMAADDFVQVTNYLKHLTPVADVKLEEITGSEMIVKVSLRGSTESFKQALAMGHKLSPVLQDNKQVVYQWNH